MGKISLSKKEKVTQHEEEILQKNTENQPTTNKKKMKKEVFEKLKLR